MFDVQCKSTLLLCREKFQNYLGDLGKHGKQLQGKNDQLLEELQGLSKRYLVLPKNKSTVSFSNVSCSCNQIPVYGKYHLN